MRETLIRVNIILLKDQHERFKKYAQRYHGSLSQFLRLAGENEIDKQEDTNALILQPLMEQQEKLYQGIRKVDQQVKLNYDVISSSNKLSQMHRKQIALEIEELLISIDDPVTIPEMGEYISHPPDDLVQGVEWLLDHGRIRQIEQINAPSKYRIMGGY